MQTDKIVSIEEIGERESMDIEVTGNHLFFANEILTHNSSTDVGLEDTSESFGLPATADLMFAIISTEQMEEVGQILVKQLKNRYNDPTSNRKFVVGIDRAKMRLFDVSQAAQDELVDTGQTKDDTPSFDIATGGKFRKQDFSGFDYE
jgi:hypothetical protein